MSINPEPRQQQESRHLQAVDTVPVQQTDPAIANSANWFYWIVGLSLINTGLLFFGDMSFALGLSSVLYLNMLGGEIFGTAGFVFSYLMEFAILGVFVGIGIFASRGHSWAFITGFGLYLLDTLFEVTMGLIGGFSVISLVVHAYVLFVLFGGVIASFSAKTD